MNFTLTKSAEVLERTPFVIEYLLNGISGEWYNANEGAETFSPYDVVGHLIHGEKCDWLQRAEIILSGSMTPFTPFDRFAQKEESKGKTLEELIKEFKNLREENLRKLRAKNISETDLKKKGIHPALGEVTLENLISTWVAHDLGHIAQITRVMAKHYKEEVGPWLEYLTVLKR